MTTEGELMPFRGPGDAEERPDLPPRLCYPVCPRCALDLRPLLSLNPPPTPAHNYSLSARCLVGTESDANPD
jgi:hypothetical protein